MQRDLPVHIIRYESLKTNLREELVKVVHFLGLTVNQKRLDCVIQNPEGKFHRPARDNFTIPFTPEMKRLAEAAVQNVEILLKDKMPTE